MTPRIPEELGTLCIENVALGEARLSIEAAGHKVSVEGLPKGVRLVLGQ